MVEIDFGIGLFGTEDSRMNDELIKVVRTNDLEIESLILVSTN